MAIETKEIIAFLGFKEEEVPTLDALKAKFEPEFIRTSAINAELEPVKKLIGEVYGSVNTDFQKIAKANEINIEDIEEWKNAKVKDKLKILTTEISKKKDSIIEDLTKKASLNNDEKLNEITTLLEKEKLKRKEIDGLLKQVSTDFDAYKVTATDQLKNIKSNTLKNGALSTVKWKDGITELEQEGYNSIINKKYKFELDETGTKLEAKDAEGKQIPNPKVTGTFKSVEEVLVEEAVKLNLYKLNSDNGKKKEVEKKIEEKGAGQGIKSDRVILGR